uniref:Uncharacterized protein n=1 Tax=Brassica campestris TaxID=3711 RepID=M4F5N0_BRACM
MNVTTHQSEGTSRRSIRSKNPNSADNRLPSIDTSVSTSIDSHYKPKLSLSTNSMSIDYDFLLPDEFGIFQGPRWLRKSDGRKDSTSIQRGHSRYFSVGQWSRKLVYVATQHPRQQSNCSRHISKGYNNMNWVTPTSLDEAPSPSIDRRYECGRRAYDSYGARKFRWEQKDEYGVYIDESGHARSAASDMIPITKDDIRKILERASLFGEGHICLPDHATTCKPTTLPPEIYTKDEINEIVTGICGTREKLGDELKTLVDDTYQPLDRGYNELFRCMAELRTEIESMQHSLEKEAKTSTSIDANKATSIDVKPQTSQIPAEPECLAKKKDEWEIAYINTRIKDIYDPLNNNVDWLSTRIDLVQQKLDTIRMNDPQPATSIDICNITSIDTRFAEMEDRLKLYEDMHDRFTSPIMRYLYTYMETLSTQMMNVQKHIEYAYSKISCYQFSIEDILERLQNISNAVQKMDERWTRNDEATRSFIAAWSRMCTDEVNACFPTSSCFATN